MPVCVVCVCELAAAGLNVNHADPRQLAGVVLSADRRLCGRVRRVERSPAR